MNKLMLSIPLLCGIAAAQTFNGTHYLGDVCGFKPSGGTNCSYVGNIANDPYAAYVWVTDQVTGGAIVINPHATPPSVNLTGLPWYGSFKWDDGTGLTVTVLIVSGSCSLMGGQTDRYTATYTEMCSGTDANGNPVSKFQHFVSNLSTGRGGSAWQPVGPGPWGTFQGVTPGAIQVPPPPPPVAPPPPPTGDDGGSN